MIRDSMRPMASLADWLLAFWPGRDADPAIRLVVA